MGIIHTLRIDVDILAEICSILLKGMHVVFIFLIYDYPEVMKTGERCTFACMHSVVWLLLVWALVLLVFFFFSSWERSISMFLFFFSVETVYVVCLHTSVRKFAFRAVPFLFSVFSVVFFFPCFTWSIHENSFAYMGFFFYTCYTFVSVVEISFKCTGFTGVIYTLRFELVFVNTQCVLLDLQVRFFFLLFSQPLRFIWTFSTFPFEAISLLLLFLLFFSFFFFCCCLNGVCFALGTKILLPLEYWFETFSWNAFSTRIIETWHCFFPLLKYGLCLFWYVSLLVDSSHSFFFWNYS